MCLYCRDLRKTLQIYPCRYVCVYAYVLVCVGSLVMNMRLMDLLLVVLMLSPIDIPKVKRLQVAELTINYL